MQRIMMTISGVFGLLGATGPLRAQIPESPGPPPGEPSALPYVIGILMVAVLAAAAMKSARRSHQD
jgi:hypothetical protein